MEEIPRMKYPHGTLYTLSLLKEAHLKWLQELTSDISNYAGTKVIDYFL
jgi:hypothetical protein